MSLEAKYESRSFVVKHEPGLSFFQNWGFFYFIRMTYAEKLQDPRWQQLRLLILKRDKWKCSLCQDTKTTLHIHHLKYIKEPWNADPCDLKTVCRNCHSLLEHIKKSEVNGLVVVKSVEKVLSLTGVLHLFVYCTAETGNRVIICTYYDDFNIDYLLDITSKDIDFMNKKLKKIKK